MRNEFKEICDKLINPIDALDSRLSIYMKQNSGTDLTAMNKMVEDIKTILNEFREMGYDKVDREKTYTASDIIKMLDVSQKACNLPKDNDILISRGFIEQELGLGKMTLNGYEKF